MTEASKLRPRRDPDPEDPGADQAGPVDLTKQDRKTDGSGSSAASPEDVEGEPEGVTAADSAEDPADDPDELADSEDRAYRREMRRGLVLGAGTGVLVGVIVSLVLGGLVWPGWFVGPGSPDGAATAAISALSARDINALDAVTCKGTNGQLTSQIPADALQEVAGAVADGPVTRTIDSEANVPMNLTVSAQGQTQAIPTSLILGVNDGSWCLVGLAQRQ